MVSIEELVTVALGNYRFGWYWSLRNKQNSPSASRECRAAPVCSANSLVLSQSANHIYPHLVLWALLFRANAYSRGLNNYQIFWLHVASMPILLATPNILQNDVGIDFGLCIMWFA